MLMANQPLLR